MHHGTFKATARREGEWRENWNELLADPLNRAIVVEWDQALNHKLPSHIDEALRSVRAEVWRLQEELGLPAQPFKEAADMLDSKSAVIKAELQKRQMELSRRIKDNIKTLMGDSYREAEGQRGTGMDIRQKQVIREQVQSRGTAMFREASAFLKGELDRLLEHVHDRLLALTGNVVVTLERSMVLMCAKADEMVALRHLRDTCASPVAEALRSLEAMQPRWQALTEQAEAKEARCRDDNFCDVGMADVHGQAAAPQIPHECFCPISQSIMKDPVSTVDGHTYEREQIEKWLSVNSTSPVTGLPLGNKALIPNHSLRKIILDHVPPRVNDDEDDTPSIFARGGERGED